MIDDTELHLRELLQRRVQNIDERSISGGTVRHYGGRKRRQVMIGTPLTAAAAVAALIIGVTVASAHPNAGPVTSPTPASSNTPLTSAPHRPDHGFGLVPPCPSTYTLPGDDNHVCSIGQAPTLKPGQVIIRSVPTGSH